MYALPTQSTIRFGLMKNTQRTVSASLHQNDADGCTNLLLKRKHDPTEIRSQIFRVKIEIIILFRAWKYEVIHECVMLRTMFQPIRTQDVFFGKSFETGLFER